MENGQSVQMNFSGTERELQIILAVSRKMGLNNRSAAFRAIVNQYEEDYKVLPPTAEPEAEGHIPGLA